MVGAEDADLGVARLHAPLELVEAPLVDGAECLDRAHLPPSILSWDGSWKPRAAPPPGRLGGGASSPRALPAATRGWDSNPRSRAHEAREDNRSSTAQRSSQIGRRQPTLIRLFSSARTFARLVRSG